MRCGRCGQEFSGNFCPRCGTPAVTMGYTFLPRPQLCARCGTGFFGTYCPNCGTMAIPPSVPVFPVLPPQRYDWVREIFAVAWLLAVGLYFVLLVVNLSALALASGYIVPGILEQDRQACVTGTGARVPCVANLFVLLPFPIPTNDGGLTVLLSGPRLAGSSFLAWFLCVLTALVAAHLFLLWRDGPVTWRDLRSAGARLRAASSSESAWLTLAQVFGAVLFFDTVYFLILGAVGINPQPPTGLESGAPWYELYALANAPVYEEVLSRVVYLGLLLGALSLLVAASSRRRQGLKPWDYFLGSKFRIDRLTVGPWVFSAVLFGLAHVLGGSWASWKFVDTFIAGLALGYLFLRRGIAASILLHFSIDYLSASVSLMTLMESNLLAVLGLAFLGLLTLILSVIGAAFLAHYGYEAFKLLRRVLALPPGGALQPHPSAVQAPGFTVGPPTLGGRPSGDRGNPTPAFLCPQCGSTVALHDGSAMRCARCGFPP